LSTNSNSALCLLIQIALKRSSVIHRTERIRREPQRLCTFSAPFFFLFHQSCLTPSTDVGACWGPPMKKIALRFTKVHVLACGVTLADRASVRGSRLLRYPRGGGTCAVHSYGDMVTVTALMEDCRSGQADEVGNDKRASSDRHSASIQYSSEIPARFLCRRQANIAVL